MKKCKWLLLVIVILLACGCSSGKSVLSNTKWNGSDNSYLVFSNDGIRWYQKEEVKDKNYYSGKYKVFRGEKAVKYITEDLSKYGITRSKLENFFDSKYKKENFIVVDIAYNEIDINGVKQEKYRAENPWYGFISEDGEKMEVVNMNTASTYHFTKIK